MTMPGRSYNSSSYRFGFNGMEKDDEVKGSGNSYDFGARIYDPRLGIWLSLDPLASKYPAISPYVAFADNPIFFVDKDGREIWIYEPNSDKAYLYCPNDTKIDESTSEYVKTVVKTLDYIVNTDKDSYRYNIITTLSNDNSIISIEENSNYKEALGATLILTSTNNIAQKIPWSSESGLKQDGVMQSPATGLLHELAEAYYLKYDPEGLITQTPDINDSEAYDCYVETEKNEVQEYHSYADKWIINNVEPEMNEGKRYQHDSEKKERFKAKNSTSNEEIK